jgi:putative flippase GtrA
MIFTDSQERRRFFRFVFVGIVGAIVDFGIFNLLTSVSNIPSIWAQTISFTSAVISNFLWNRYWTYPDSRSKPVLQQMLQFAFVSLIGLGIRTLIFALIESLLINFFTKLLSQIHWALSPVKLGYNITLAIGVGVVLLWNFFINRFWTYSDVSSPKSRPSTIHPESTP